MERKKKSNKVYKALKNASITLFCQVIYILLSFICRTVFTRLLGAEYLGLNGLFTNILTMLSFVELGVGSALVYKLYKPLADNDKYLLCVYVSFYKKVYTIIAFVVGLIGISITPFLKYIVNVPNIDINIYIVYLLFLFDTVISYLYVYKKSILIADQRNYVVAIYTQIFNAIMNVVQIITLIFTHNFYLYLIVKIVCDWLNNIFCSRRAERDYPYIKQECNDDISIEDKLELKKNVKGLFLGKIASVAFDGTDNIFISMYVNIASVGILSNYTLILTTINTLFNQVFNSLTSTIGHLGVEENTDEVEKVLKRLYFVNSALYGYLFVGTTILLEFFVTKIWLNDAYSLPSTAVLLIVLELVLRGLHYPMYITRTAMGLFKQLKTIPPLCAILNIGLDIVLGSRYGIVGIVSATIISRIITRATDIFVVYKYKFHKSSIEYYMNHFIFLVIMGICTLASFRLINLISISNIYLAFISDCIVITCIYWITIILFYRKTDQYNYFYKLFKSKMGK